MATRRRIHVDLDPEAIASAVTLAEEQERAPVNPGKVDRLHSQHQQDTLGILGQNAVLDFLGSGAELAPWARHERQRQWKGADGGYDILWREQKIEVKAAWDYTYANFLLGRTAHGDALDTFRADIGVLVAGVGRAVFPPTTLVLCGWFTVEDWDLSSCYWDRVKCYVYEASAMRPMADLKRHNSTQESLL